MLRIHIQYAVECRLETWRHDEVARPFWRLYWNPDPGWRVVHQGRAWPLAMDRLLVVAPETIYQTTSAGPSRHIFMHFTCSGLTGTPLPGIHRLPFAGAFPALLADGQRHGFSELRATALACHALAQLPATAFGAGGRSPAIAAAEALGRRFLHRLVANEELARAADMHVNAFIRRFRAETGQPPRRWHLQQRIEAACLALEAGGEPVDDIAARFGFCDRHHFTRVFTRLRGLAPAAYRRTATYLN